MGKVLRAAGTSWEKVVKVNIYLKNMDDFAAMNERYNERECLHGFPVVHIQELTKLPVFIVVPNPKPARTCIQAAKLPFDVDVEIEAIAAA